ncbi:DUF4097 family beta strand repeat protein [Solirubrobacter sp. CPCC 204708]|uniref:DUF4097 domain-containing protein n=1 Tax=Solirubrobacter deserti TaxID=2282478 RepID=A0ABT4RRW4_9ACTN|nr:DUF4097 family beta strand repeat-containing protein [Solirubrobacter deserti]MBE2318717.1 DUF4097 family beta strand repeat protein [Solirubrobacter deserti]MDA0141307.1 DUF4097 domain-containing protein [Solirubrobacter deserti]
MSAVRVELEVGNVQLLAKARSDVAVDASPSNPRRSGDRASAEAVRVDQVGDAVVIRGPHKPRIFGPGKDSVDLVVEVPETSAVEATVKFGTLRMTGRFAAVDAEVPFGEFVLDSAERLTLKGGHGDYRVTNVDGDADIHFKSGSMRVGHVGGALQLTGADGPITVDRVDGPAELKTSSGSLELGTAASDATIRSAYGSVRVRQANAGVIRIDGSYGSVDVGVRRGTAVWLDATSQYGVVRTDLAADAGPAADEQTLELHVRTGYGSIDIHRSDS